MNRLYFNRGALQPVSNDSERLTPRVLELNVTLTHGSTWANMVENVDAMVTPSPMPVLWQFRYSPASGTSLQAPNSFAGPHSAIRLHELQ
jgi:hypothetical protein